YDCGWGQPFLKAVSDGLALFYITPDWRAYTYQADLPGVFGRMALMPLPAWEKGGRRTSVWGGTGLVITRATKHPDLAWALAKHLYLSQADLGERFKDTGIIPPLKDAWALPEFRAFNPYFSGQPVGKLYASLAPETPPVQASPIINIARSKVDVAYTRVVEHYRSHGEQGLSAVIERELRGADAEVRRMAERTQALQRGE
ncbi:MAG TPA: extracellular solute-binding protein, partial [Polyangiaceae bacterium]|nr:extracellular solute-binding protein [Polyangiaceae bacterium]